MTTVELITRKSLARTAAECWRQYFLSAYHYADKAAVHDRLLALGAEREGVRARRPVGVGGPGGRGVTTSASAAGDGPAGAVAGGGEQFPGEKGRAMSEGKTTKIPPGWWPCACVKRDRRGVMKAIKFHPGTTKRCRVCKAERPPAGVCP